MTEEALRRLQALAEIEAKYLEVRLALLDAIYFIDCSKDSYMDPADCERMVDKLRKVL